MSTFQDNPNHQDAGTDDPADVGEVVDAEPVDEQPGNELVIKTTGEVIDLDAGSDQLTRHVAEINAAYKDLANAKDVLIGELARRLDRSNARKQKFGRWEAETNAPTTEVYTPSTLLKELDQLVEQGHADAELIDAIMPFPTPEEVDAFAKTRGSVKKVEINKLKKTDPTTPAGRAILAALARAREIVPQKRTLKVRKLKMPKGEVES